MCTLCGDNNESDSPSSDVHERINDTHTGDNNEHDTPSDDEGDANERAPLLNNC